jgi:UDP-N-acetylglucosamine diphosphorylase / glucose-1-phosphate thymidylyltransferase / UDP-N-acetylgalactosamine diphosphorylase / glucosamine-1-phosphate N-acetyltransferase / galactosamine-1-phosphate N-acetyltransferase
VTRLYLYDDAAAREFEPFCLSRPVGELRAGVELIRARWEHRLQLPASGFIGAEHLQDFEEPGAPPAVPPDHVLEPDSIVASTRCVVALSVATQDRAARVWRCDGRVAAVRLHEATPASRLSDGTLQLDQLARGAGTDRAARAEDSVPMTPAAAAGVVELEGRWLEAVWDLVGTLTEQLTQDIPAFAGRLTIHNHAELRILGSHPVFCERGAVIEPWVVLDAGAGPILIRSGATVSAFSRLVGPCYVGEHSSIIGDRVGACSIGDTCKVRGEISNSILVGHSNKGHTGFVGHSYIGRWVNLGAGTTTSNLKNTYGQVQLATRHGPRDTGQQFLGTFFGDHVKTGIGTMLTTGTLLGTGANVFGAVAPPKRVPAFAWGEREPYQRFEREKFIAVAERVMKRRDVALSERARRHLQNVHDLVERGGS